EKSFAIGRRFSSHRSEQIFKRIDTLHWGIGPIGDDRTMIYQNTPGIRSSHSHCGSNLRDDHRSIGGTMDGLHTGNDTNLAKTTKIGWLHDLGMLYSPTQILAILLIFFK